MVPVRLSACCAALLIASHAYADSVLEDQLASLSESDVFSYQDAVIEDGVLRFSEPEYSLRVPMPIPSDGGEAPASAVYRWSAPSLDMSEGDAPGELVYTFPKTQRFSTEFEGLPDDADAPTAIDYEITAEGMVLVTDSTDDLQLFDLVADVMVMTLDETSLAQRGDVSVAVSFNSEDLRYSGYLPKALSYGSMDALEEDWRLDFELGAMDGTVSMRRMLEDGSPERVEFGVTAQRAEGVYELEDAALKLDAKLSGFGAQGTVPEEAEALFSGPVRFSVETLHQKLEIPLRASDAPQQALIEYLVEDVELDSKIWDLIDPKNVLVRDLSRLRVALRGEGILRVGLSDLEDFDPMQAGDALPIEPGIATIEEIAIEALGSKLRAVGEFDLAPTMDGLPPIGSGTIHLHKWRALMASLVEAGFAPPEQAMMTQMMLENFVQPSEGEGNSMIEIELGDGMMLLNGVPFGPLPGAE